MFLQDSSVSYDYYNRDYDPTPDEYFGDEPDSHGTMCAGVIGMAKSNARCGVGVAHHARIGGTCILYRIYVPSEHYLQ